MSQTRAFMWGKKPEVFFCTNSWQSCNEQNAKSLASNLFFWIHNWNPRIICFFVNSLILPRIILYLIVLGVNTESIQRQCCFMLIFLFLNNRSAGHVLPHLCMIKPCPIPPSMELKTTLWCANSLFKLRKKRIHLKDLCKYDIWGRRQWEFFAVKL